MDKIINITREDVPCWYELGWREDVPAIVLRLHKDFVANSGIIFGNNRMVKYFQKIFKLNGWSQLFCGDFNNEFVEFNNALRNIGENNDFINFAIDILALNQEGAIK